MKYNYPYGYIPYIGEKFNEWTVIDNNVVLIKTGNRNYRSVKCRCRCGNEKLVGICLYKPEYYSSRSIIPVETIQYFVNQMILKLKLKNYVRYVLDCFIYNDDPTKVYFIELNPFEEYIDPFSFDYDIINNTRTLLVTI